MMPRPSATARPGAVTSATATTIGSTVTRANCAISGLRRGRYGTQGRRAQVPPRISSFKVDRPRRHRRRTSWGQVLGTGSRFLGEAQGISRKG